MRTGSRATGTVPSIEVTASAGSMAVTSPPASSTDPVEQIGAAPGQGGSALVEVGQPAPGGVDGVGPPAGPQQGVELGGPPVTLDREPGRVGGNLVEAGALGGQIGKVEVGHGQGAPGGTR